MPKPTSLPCSSDRPVSGLRVVAIEAPKEDAG